MSESESSTNGASGPGEAEAKESVQADEPTGHRHLTVLLADDDEDDRLLTKEAFAEAGAAVDFRCVCDGEELLDYLARRGRFTEPGAAPRPDLILLDLNMPRMNGHEALELIKQGAETRTIPVVALSTSRSAWDVSRQYELGASSYLAKPNSFDELVDAVEKLTQHWLGALRPPGENRVERAA